MVRSMKQTAERVIPLHGLLRVDPGLPDRIERTAQEMADQGWFFVSSCTDEQMEALTLFFEKDLEV